VGRQALEGLDGVFEVTSGWRDGREINTATYDPERIKVEDMVGALEAAGTFIGVAE